MAGGSAQERQNLRTSALRAVSSENKLAKRNGRIASEVAKATEATEIKKSILSSPAPPPPNYKAPDGDRMHEKPFDRATWLKQPESVLQ